MEAEAIRSRSGNSNNKNKRSRSRSRKPLADCTNLSQTSSTNNNSSSFPSSSFKKAPILSNFPNPKNKPGSTASKPTAVLPSTPSRPPLPSSLPGIASEEISEPHSVYTRRQSAADKRNRKGKAIAEATSYTPAPKRESSRDKVNEVGVTWSSKSCTGHLKKKQCGALPEDFIEQQRAYFAEIDAFELSEEEVGSINELD